MSNPYYPPSTIYPTQLLFHRGGISVTATVLTPNATTDGTGALQSFDPDTEHNGIIVTLYLHRHAEKNVINPTMIQLLIEALDVIESHELLVNTNNKSLIITGLSPPAPNATPHGKFFSNGLDLEWMLQSSASETPSMIQNFNSQVLARILTLPYCTVAAINGHCIGAGLFLALACDYRIMRTERGYIQWPEARLGMRLTKGFAELSKAKIVAWRHGDAVAKDRKGGGGMTTTSTWLDRNVLREGIFTAKKYTPSEALECGIIDSQCPVEELYEYAFQWAVDGLPESEGRKLKYFDPMAYSMMKMEMYTDAYRALKFGSVEDLPYSRI